MKYLVSLFLILLIPGCKQSQVPVQVQNDVDSIIFKYVPDRREGIYDLHLEILKDHRLLIRGETNIPEVKEEVIKYFADSGFEYYDSLKVLPDASEIGKPWGIVTVSVCNIKKEPSHSSEMVTQAIMGTPVKILKKNDNWLLIQTPDYYIGWAAVSGIKDFDEAEMAKWKKSKRLIFTEKSGDILSENDNKSVVSDIVAGSIVNLVSDQRENYIVGLPDGRKGLLNKKSSVNLCSWCHEIKPEADKLIGFAKSMTGTPYLWGGTSTKMVDCSGFVKTVYFMGGIILSRDASQQFLHGEEVDISTSLDVLKPGDLLFFGSINEKGMKRITHTAMYIGNKEFIHSSVSNGMVWNNSLDSTKSNYSNSLFKMLMGARRIIGTEPARGIEHIASHRWYN